MNDHDDVIKWKHFPRYWPYVRGFHRGPVNSPHKGQWREALIFSLICARINSWVNNGEDGDLRRHRGHYDVIVMTYFITLAKPTLKWEQGWIITIHCIEIEVIVALQYTVNLTTHLTKAYDVTIQRYRKSHTEIRDNKVQTLRCVGSKFRVHKISNPYSAKYAFY